MITYHLTLNVAGKIRPLLIHADSYDLSGTGQHLFTKDGRITAVVSSPTIVSIRQA
jgi:hypothetical protein